MPKKPCSEYKNANFFAFKFSLNASPTLLLNLQKYIVAPLIKIKSSASVESATSSLANLLKFSFLKRERAKFLCKFKTSPINFSALFLPEISPV